MPRFLQPSKLTQHRVAAIALYRALLSRCSFAAVPDEDRSSLRNAIRNKFRNNRKVQSPRQLGLVFQAGYKTLEYLDASKNGDAKSISSLASLISNLPNGLKRTPTFGPRPPPPPDPSRKRLACLPPDRAVLNVRPYAQVSGPRHVPILASANGIPFLRITKPQPPALSRILRQKLDRRINRFNLRVLLSNYWLPMSVYEDQWDAILERECGVKICANDGIHNPNWADAIVKARILNNKVYEKDIAMDKVIARKMRNIVCAEMRLAKQEGQKVIRGRKKKPIRSRWPT